MSKCKECKWFSKQDSEAIAIHKSGVSSDSNDGVWTCRRNAPSIIELKRVADIVHAELGFPKMHPEDWCGDFEPK